MNLHTKRQNQPNQLYNQHQHHNNNYNNNNINNINNINNKRNRNPQNTNTIDSNQIVQLANNVNSSFLLTSDTTNIAYDDQLVQKFYADQYSPEFWSSLLDKIFITPIDDNLRYLYEACLRLFPLSVRTWKQYIEHEIRDKQYTLAKGLFDRCLPYVYHLDIYTLYIDYIKKTQDLVAKAHSQSSDIKVSASAYDSYYAQVQVAYEFALDSIGYDVKAAGLWKDYIDFLKSVPVQTEIHKRYKEDALSLAYSKALSLPIHNIGVIGKDFEEFLFRLQNKQDQDNFAKSTMRSDIASSHVIKTREKFHNALTKPAFLINSEYSRFFPRLPTTIGADCDFPAPFPILSKRHNCSLSTMTSLLYQRNAVIGNITDDLGAQTNPTNNTLVDKNSTPPGAHFDPWIGHWKGVIDYERTNPQRIPYNILRSRVAYMYKKAMPYCLHSTLFWIDQIDYLADQHRSPFGNTTVTPQSVESPLLWVNTIYGNGNVNFMTNGDDIRTIIQTLYQQCDHYKNKVLNAKNEKDKNHDHRYATLADVELIQQQTKIQQYQYIQRLQAYQYHIQTNIYTTWEMALKFMGYSIVLRQYYVDYATSHSLPADDMVKKAIQLFIDDKITPLASSDTQYSAKATCYSKINQDITTRAEQLLWTIFLESEHENSLGSTLPYQLPIDAMTLINQYGGLTHFFNTTDISQEHLFHLFEELDQKKNTIITLPSIPFQLSTDTSPTIGKVSCVSQVSTFVIQDIELIRNDPNKTQSQQIAESTAEQPIDYMEDDSDMDSIPTPQETLTDLADEVSQPSLPQVAGGCILLAPLGSKHAVSAITQKERNNQNKAQVQEPNLSPELNINKHLPPISPAQLLFIFSFATTATATPSMSLPITDNPLTDSQITPDQLNEETTTQDLTSSLPLPFRLYTAVIHATPYRTPLSTLDEFPIINFFEYKRILTDSNNVRTLWNDVRKCSSIFNWRSFLYYANLLAIHGSAKDKSNIIVLYTKAEECLLARESAKYHQQFQSQLRTDLTGTTEYIKKMLFQVEIFIVQKRIQYLEQTYSLLEALNAVNKLLQNPIMTESLDLQTTYVTLYNKMVQLSLAVGVNKGFSDVHKLQLKRQHHLKTYEPLTALVPLEPPNPQQLQTHQFNLLKVQQTLSGTARFHHHHPKQTIRQLRSQASVQSLIVSTMTASAVYNANTDELEHVQGNQGSFIPLPLESPLEIASTAFPDYVQTLLDPITLGTFKNIPISLPTFPEIALGVKQATPLTTFPNFSTSSAFSSTTPPNFLALCTGSSDSINAPPSGNSFSTTSNQFDLDPTSTQVIPHSVIQSALQDPVRVTVQNQRQNPKDNTAPTFSTETHYRAPNLRKVGVWTKHDGKFQAINAFKQPNLTKFTPYDPRVHAKLAFPSDIHYQVTENNIMKFVTKPSKDNHNNDSDDDDSNDTKVDLVPVNTTDTLVTTRTFAQSPTYNENGVENEPIQFKTLLKTNLIKLYANQTFTPYIGLIYYNQFSSLSAYLRGVCLSNNFLYLFKAVAGTTRSSSDILPKLPSTTVTRAANYTALSNVASNAQNIDPDQLKKIMHKEYQIEKEHEYHKIQQMYYNSAHNIDRKATFQLLKRAAKQPGVKLTLTTDEIDRKTFSPENVADIIMNSILNKNVLLSSQQQLPPVGPQHTLLPPGINPNQGPSNMMGPPPNNNMMGIKGPPPHGMGVNGPMGGPPPQGMGQGPPPHHHQHQNQMHFPTFPGQQNRHIGPPGSGPPPGNMGGMGMQGGPPNNNNNNNNMMRPNNMNNNMGPNNNMTPMQPHHMQNIPKYNPNNMGPNNNMGPR